MDSNVDSFARGIERRASTNLYTRYRWTLKWSRLLRVAFWTLMAFFLFWAIPWLPGGLSEEDYTRRVTLTLLLGGTAIVSGVAALVLREWLRRLEETLVAFNAVYDNTTGLYNRRYFYDRLTLECERSQRQGNPFTLLLFRFEPETAGRKDDSGTLLRFLGDELIRETRGSDLVAVLGSNELAVAAVGVDRQTGAQLAERLRSSVAKVLAERLPADGAHPVQVGISQYPADGSNAAALLRLARESMREPASAQSRASGESETEAA